VFAALYGKAMKWAEHRHAAWGLAGLSFAESSFFPIPPDVMLAPMALAQRHRAWWFAFITTVASVLGGVLGYMIGMFSFEMIEEWLQGNQRYWDGYLLAQQWFDEYGIWAVLIAGFSPIPYKVFTISAGVASMALLPFVLASLVGRGARFFLVAGLIVLGGEKMEKAIRKNINRIGWGLVALLVVAYLLLG